MGAYLALPKGRAKAPGILVIQEIFGVNKVMRDITDGFAARGLPCHLPRSLLADRARASTSPTSRRPSGQRAFELYQAFDVDKGVEDIDRHLERPAPIRGCSGKVGASASAWAACSPS